MAVHPPLSELGFSEEAAMQSVLPRYPIDFPQEVPSSGESYDIESDQLLNLEGGTLFELHAVEQQFAPERSKRILAYDTDLDAREAMKMKLQQLQMEQGNSEYARLLQRQLALGKRQELTFNQEVYIMERHRAPIGRSRKHTIAYNEKIHDYDLYPDGTDIPMLTLIDNGITYREGQGSTEENIQENGIRERAERVGMEFSRNLFRDKKTPAGTKIFSFSPPSGDYKNNFFDGFELREDEEGNRYVYMQRYATSLSPEDYEELIPRLTDGAMRFDHTPTPAELLSQPVVLPYEKFETISDVRNYLHRDKQIEFTNGRIMERVLEDEDVRAAMQRYIDVLFQNPTRPEKYKAAFRSMINITDAIVYREKYGYYETEQVERLFELPFGVAAAEFEQMSSKRMVSDCGDGFGAEEAGGLGGFTGRGIESPNWSPFSVADFGTLDRKRTWSYDRSGNCQGPCKKNFRDGGLGPCKICRECESKLPMLSKAQLEALKNKEGDNITKEPEKATKQKKEKQPNLSPDQLLASIKRSIPNEKPGVTEVIAIPEEKKQSRGWSINILGRQKDLTQEQEKKATDKMTLYNYAMLERDIKETAHVIV